MRKVKPEFNGQFGKLPPQAVDVEMSLIGQCLSWEANREYLPFLKPEHFYKDAHQKIWKAIISVGHPTLETVASYLKKAGELEDVGGAFALTQLSRQYMNPAQLEQSGRIIQQMFIKRELIRISSHMIQNGYDDSTDCVNLFDQYYKQMADLEKIFDQGTHGEISSRENEQEYMELSRTGQVKNGLSTGFESLDDHFRFANTPSYSGNSRSNFRA